MAAPHDLLIVGGGINGAGIARDAAGRGMSVLLVETGDLGGATSSASSKLIHGGLRYLEYGAFRLVRESLKERAILMRSAPHIIRPLRFVLPHAPHLRPAWMIRLGLFLYDHIGGRGGLPGSGGLDLRTAPEGAPLRPEFRRGFAYSDCRVDDARLVVLAALDAAERGAEIRPRTEFVGARRDGLLWRATLRAPDGGETTVAARALVNAAGPWVDRVAMRVRDGARAPRLRLVQGSHLVLPRLHDGDQAYILQNPDGRVVFAIPWEGRFTLVGTTEQPFDGDPGDAAPTEVETAYLCETMNRHFRTTVTPADAVHAFAGVRPLHDDGKQAASAVTRDYVFDLDAPEGAAPLLSVHGGKLTTFRRLSEHATDRLAPLLGVTRGPWTATAPLPGGDLPQADVAAFHEEFRQRHPFLPAPLARRLVRLYGTRADHVLDGARTLDALGPDLCDGADGGLHAAEIAYLRRVEWARTAEDVLWRRTKVGLHTGAVEAERIERAFAAGA